MATNGTGGSVAWKTSGRREIGLLPTYLKETLTGLLAQKGVSFVLGGNQREVHDAVECALQRAFSTDGKAYLPNDGKMMPMAARFVRPAGSNSACVQSVNVMSTAIRAMVQIGSFEEGKDLVVGVRLPPPGNIYQDWMRLFVALCAEFACLQHHATSGKHLMPGFYAGYTSFDSLGREMGMARRMTLKLRAEYSDDYMRKLTQELSVKGVMLLRWRKPQQFNPRRYTRINMAHISQQCEVEILASDIALGEMVESGLVLGVEQKPYYYTPLLAKREEAISIRRKAALDAFLVERGLRTKKAGGVPKRATAQAVADEIQAKANIILKAHGQRLQEAETAKAIFPQVNIDVDQEQAPAAAVKAKAGEESAALAQRVAKEKAAKEKASAEEAARVKKEQAKVGAHVSKKKEEAKPSEAARVENEEIGCGGKKPANVAQDEAANTTVAAQTGAEGAPAEIATMRKDVGAPAPAPAATSAQPQRVNKVSRAPQRRQPATDASTDADAKVEGRVSDPDTAILALAPDDDDAAPNLAADTEARQKRMLGESLYPLVCEMHPKLGGKITGMLLETSGQQRFAPFAGGRHCAQGQGG